MLELHGVTAGYGDTTVLWDVSLRVGRGEAVALLGRNGMGKTTTLRAIMGLNPARGGRIVFKDTDVTRLPPFEIARLGIGYAPEGAQLFAPLTVLQNLRIPFVNKQRDRARWPGQLERVFQLFPRLAERRSQKAGTMSGGEQQMCAMGRALMARPKLLMLDEPSLGLAPIFVERIFDIVREINKQGTSVLLVEQNALMALDTAHRGYVLETGKIALADDAKALRHNDEVRKTYLAEA